MQQTSLDRFLRKKLVYITRIYCNTLPKKVPFGVNVETAPEESGGRYQYKLSTRSEAMVTTISERLGQENITYTTRIEDRNVWFAKYFNHPQKSFTYRMTWLGIFVMMGILTACGMPMKLWNHLTADEKSEDELAAETVVAEPVDNDVRIFELEQRMLEIDRLKE